jgi:hypothetical protein
MRSRERSEMIREIEEREIERLRRSGERESQRLGEGVADGVGLGTQGTRSSIGGG